MSKEYTDLLIRVFDRPDQLAAYPVEATLGDGSFFPSHLRLDLDALLRANLDPKEYGHLLCEALFAGPVGRAYDRARGQAQSLTGGCLRLRLWLDDNAPELHALPWERLYHYHDEGMVPLSVTELTPFSRYTGLGIAEPQPLELDESEGKLRVLFAISNPRNLEEYRLAPINVEGEVMALRQALGDLQQVEVTLLPGCSGLPSEVRAQLPEGYRIEDGETSLDRILDLLEDHHVFHFLGHGRFLKSQEEDGRGTTVLYLEKKEEDGTVQLVQDSELVPHLQTAHRRPHLVFLAACESGKRDPEQTFVGLGPKLVRAGVPAVVVMQNSVTMPLAQRLTGHFYRQLLRHGVVDLALNEARHHVFKPDQVDWAIPVLYMRLETGQLLAADPVRAALEAIHNWSKDDFVPLSIEVAHLVGPPDPGSLERLEQEPAPSLDLVETALRVLSEPRPAQTPAQKQGGKLVVLVGSPGTAKTTQLRRIACQTAEDSLSSTSARQVIPVYVDLGSFAAVRSGALNAVEVLTLESLQHFWPELKAKTLADLPRRDHGIILRVLFDGSDGLPSKQRREAWRRTQALMEKHPEDEYMLAVDADDFDPRLLKDATDLLVIRPLSPHTIERFLKHPKNEPHGQRLYDALTSNQLLDLATIAWLLVRMLQQAGEGSYPHSRAVVLENLVEDAIAEIPREQGMRSRARETLYALAWTMQSSRSSVLGAKETFEIMAAVRANREYSLEDLNDALVDCGLLVRVGLDRVRFAYPAIRDYCCAQAILQMPERDQILDDITASLGRLTRLRWWEGTLILLSGLMPKPRVLHRKLLYGARLTEGEEIFVTVRCLLESNDQQIEADVLNQVIDALVWQSDSANVHQTARRVRAIQALGQLGRLRPRAGTGGGGAGRRASRVQGQPGQPRPSPVIPHLARYANKQVRTNWEGKPAYDLSSVRMAAALALQRMMPRFSKQIEEIDSQLADLLRLWENKDVAALNEHLHSGDAGAQAIAAFALADIRTEPALGSLRKAIFDPKTSADTRWAVTDGLAMLDPAWVTQQVILPLIEAKESSWYERLAYLIGKIRTQDQIALTFLNRCLSDLKRVATKAEAIQSVGWLHDREKKGLLEDIAMGRFEEIENDFKLGKASEQDKEYLRSKAMEALANIGDQDTIALLREGSAVWDPELRQAAYRTSEEIRWRISLGTDR